MVRSGLRFIGQLLFAIVTGVVGAALLHLVIVLLLPDFSQRGAYSRVLKTGETHRFHRLSDTPNKAGLVQQDPFIELAVCAFDVTEMPIRLAAPDSGLPFWSLGIYDQSSNEIFSINDRTSGGSVLDVVIANPAEMAALRAGLPQALSQSILLETPHMTGYAVLRALAPQKSFEELASQFLAAASCEPFEWRSKSRF